MSKTFQSDNPPIDTVLSEIKLDITPCQGSNKGVYVVSITVVGEKLRSYVSHKDLHFDLPNPKGWVFRPVTGPLHRRASFIDTHFEPRRAVFVNGEWQAILARNIIPDANIDLHIESTLQPILDTLRMRAATALKSLRDRPVPSRPFRLFYIKPQGSLVPELAEQTYATLDEAKDVLLPEGCVKIGIPVDGNWLTYKASFGWQKLAKKNG